MPILEYDQNRDAPALAARWQRAIYLAAMLPAAAAPFINFTYDVSPLSAIVNIFGSAWQRQFDETMLLFLIAAPFFIGLFIALRAFRLLIHAPETHAERIIALCLAALSASMTLGFFAYGVYHNPPSSLYDREFLIVAAGPAIILLGGLLIIGLARFSRKSQAIIPTALHAAYIANAWICLIEFWNHRDPGWWLTLISAGAMSLHISFVLARLILHAMLSRRVIT